MYVVQCAPKYNPLHTYSRTKHDRVHDTVTPHFLPFIFIELTFKIRNLTLLYTVRVYQSFASLMLFRKEFKIRWSDAGGRAALSTLTMKPI